MEQRDAISHELADILGVDRQAFAEIVRSTFDERMRGEIGDLRQTYFTLSARLGGHHSLTAWMRPSPAGWSSRTSSSV